jgi:hypothetical protein
MAEEVIAPVVSADTRARILTGIVENRNGEPIYYGAIYNRLTNTVIPFLTPDEVSWNHSATFDEISIDGRSVTIPGYKGGSAPKVSFEVVIYDDFYNNKLTKSSKASSAVSGYSDAQNQDGSPSTILAVRNAFRALTFPVYEKGVPSPPECIVMIGDSVKFVGKCNDVSEVMKGTTGTSRDNQRVYKQSSISLSFTVIREVGSSTYSAPSATDMENGEVKF